MEPSYPKLAAESPFGWEVTRARTGPTWDEYDLTNSRHRDGRAAEDALSVETAMPDAPPPAPAPAAAAIVDVLFQNLTTPSVPPVITYP
jgi:hypothetical protein